MPDHMEELIDKICAAAPDFLQAARDRLPIAPLGLRRSARLPVAAGLLQCLEKPILIITDRMDRALVLQEELHLWAPQSEIFLFREPTPLFYENSAWGDATRQDRLTVLTILAKYLLPVSEPPSAPPVIIAPARAIMTRTMPRREFLKATHSLKPGQVVLVSELVRKWVRMGYEPTTTVIAPGQFARRGGLMDIWPPAKDMPVRIEFFGDEVDTLRQFNPATQLTLKPSRDLDDKSGRSSREMRILITPAREFLLDGFSLEGETGDDGAGKEPTSLHPGAAIALETGSERINEFSLPLLHPFSTSILDYLPVEALVLLHDWGAITDTISEVEDQAVNLRSEMIRDGIMAEDFPLPYQTLAEVTDTLSSLQCIELGYPLYDPEEGQSINFNLESWFASGPRFGGQIKPFQEYLHNLLKSGDSATIVSRQAARLKDLWDEYLPAGVVEGAVRLPESHSPGRSTSLPQPIFIENSLNEGWIFSAPGSKLVHLLTDGEIFGWKRPEARQRHRPVIDSPEAPYSDLNPGDWVVHIDHGIGQFSGLVRRTVEGSEREFLCVEYADDALLFVPIHQFDRLTRYVGPDSRSPTPSRLGGQEWKNVKTHVKEAVEEVAVDLLELYAKRSVVLGYAFGPDSVWQGELEASFPYFETDDQVRVLAEVKQDMEGPRPMDRLICGDVGYGKTEIALRASFKAVNDGKQVAILVPTTVLAQQHYNTFRQRLSAFPVSVEMLSRFRSPQQQKVIVERIQKGSIDIIIGTHRLLSKDVNFKDLGLLVIDEEQRFGVTHKEALKKMRSEVDVLTLTATPIPRTLYMALSGVRDISTINTPPEERLPIITHVGAYSPKLVRQAILRELERGGQVFFVHNRVQTIGAMRTHLENLVPEARLTIAHGQMPENELSERMELFSKGEVDLLLSTSIIESGLDIPNANTLIVDRADTFGLAQLYQLRGRVGRGAQRAYSYFFRHNKLVPTQEGRQRLDTIAENTQLGAGFNIAMRDLEIRGTGDILGNRQSGHIAAVGFHLYTRLLSESVRRMRSEGKLSSGQIHSASFEAISAQLNNVLVEIPLAVNIPVEYVPDRTVRLGLYRRMANLRAIQELDAIAEEFNDRFGPAPETVLNLVYQFKIKLLAETAGLSSIGIESSQITLRFPGGALPESLPVLDAHVRPGKMALWIAYMNLDDWQGVLMDTLQTLIAAGAPATTEA